jgi:beta-aspartyl-peptidase (threonine type)
MKNNNMETKRVVLAVHGGAGIILRSQLTPDMEEQFRSAIRDALSVGYDTLKQKQDQECCSAVDAVEAAVRCLEDCPLFNAGKGSVFGNDGKIKMDASIMMCSTIDSSKQTSCNSSQSVVDDEDLKNNKQQLRYHNQITTTTPKPQAGAVAGVRNIKNPISLARGVMEQTQHVLLIGKGAEEFAKQSTGTIETRSDDYFYTHHRWEQLMKIKQKEEEMKLQQQQKQHPNEDHLLTTLTQLDHASDTYEAILDHDERKFGTVGCIALSSDTLAAGTSTGGVTNKRFDRVGDSALIGAGTYANHLCAISCTGHGEEFIRAVAAHDIAKRLEYKYGYGSANNEGKRKDGCALEYAVKEAVFGTLEKGSGGVIALDRDGHFSAQMNTPGMYHGYVYEDGEMETRIYVNE